MDIVTDEDKEILKENGISVNEFKKRLNLTSKSKAKVFLMMLRENK